MTTEDDNALSLEPPRAHRSMVLRRRHADAHRSMVVASVSVAASQSSSKPKPQKTAEANSFRASLRSLLKLAETPAGRTTRPPEKRDSARLNAAPSADDALAVSESDQGTRARGRGRSNSDSALLPARARQLARGRGVDRAPPPGMSREERR